MPSSWFQSGVREMVSSADYWTSATLNVALVGNGTSGSPAAINLGDHSALTLQDFIDEGNTLIGSGDTLIPSRTQIFNGVQTELRFNGQVDMGSILLNDPISGAILYEGARATPATAKPLLASQQLEVGGGSTVLWGNVGVNVPGLWTPLSNSNNTAFQGTLDSLIGGVEEWVSAPFNVGFALVRETGFGTPSTSLITLAELASAGVIYCTGASPNNPVKEVNLSSGFERLKAWNFLNLQALDMYRNSEPAGGVEIKWGFAADGLIAGEVIDAIVTYIYTGAFNLATAKILNWNEANYTIVTNEDIKYGSTNTTEQGSTAVSTPELA